MGWLDDLVSASADAPPPRPASPGWGTTIGETLRNLARLDPAYAKRQDEAYLLPGRVEAQRLQSASLTSLLEDALRERGERARAPGAMESVSRAAMPRDAVTEWGSDEEGSGMTRAVAGRPAARTYFDVIAGGATPEEFDLAAKYRQEPFKALGLTTPEALAKAEEERRKAEEETVAVAPGAKLLRKRSGETVAEGAPKLGTHWVTGKDGVYAVVTDDRGTVVAKTKLEGIEPPGSKSVFTREDIARQLDLEDRLRTLGPQSPEYAKTYEEWERQAAYNDMARQQTQAPGGGVLGAGTGLRPRPAPPPAATAAGASAPPAQLPPRLLTERTPSPEQVSGYMHKRTLQPPPTGLTLSQIEASGEYAKVPTAAVGKMGNVRTAAAMLKSMEEVIARRPDLFPPLTGDSVKDGAAVSAARAKWALRANAWSPRKGTDPDIDEFLSNLSGLPGVVRSFGDVGNIAEREQAIQAEAIGVKSAAGRESAMARITNIRRLLNEGLAGLGLEPFVQPSAKVGPRTKGAAPAGAGRVDVIGPKGETGTVPQGTALPEGWRLK